MSHLRLFERLASLDLESEQRANTKRISVKSSILNHLEKLFNTPLGSVEVDQEYGLLGDATQVIGNRPPDPQLIVKRMLAQIHQYEPRLTKPLIKMQINEEDNLLVRFEISGSIFQDAEVTDITFTGAVLANGNLQFDSVN
ncbi:type VI secretion system baseplate subunit TssE [Psychrosphaera sp. 1_MG-2023]|uniref:Type VI secretion system baseplate subunit TssE n=1 Tax=Psychrosphaera algicola TaxID=3023714 RepID=A0ABT5FF47_9GAMM|nr:MULTISPECIES: type VI secretion system baseplate subunit TssE [unclassified Psychrosphaera]MDC2890178.1 type VI secretion system baseplate subunit TssE [Psychrosphaera sp. G1-22]MDO6721402.1 type VI secretion system baseplate subunit TssE [Psychrosphaera sp. 1_MG-2023]